MSKVERLNARVAKLLTVAVQEVLEVVRETVSEYQEKTARTQRENERLRRRLQELQDKQRKESIDLSSSTAGGGAAGGTPKMPPPSQNAFPLKEEQASEHTPADIEQITIKCESPRENNETSCEEMPVAQDADITKDGDEDSVHFVACYRNAVPTEKPSSKKSHSLPQKCKIETVTEMPSEARTTPESEFFRDKVLCSRGSPTHWSSGLIGAQHSEPRLNHALEPDPSVCVRVNSSPANALHTSLSGMASRPYLTVKTQIKTEADVDDCSNSAPQRDDYATADFNGLRDEIALSQDQQVATAVVAAASTSSRMSHIPLRANAAHNDSLFLENGCEAMPQDASSASMGVQLVRRGLGGVASGGALMGGRLPRPYTRHHVNHMGALPKRYCCGVCGRSFNHAGDFKKHKRVHTGEKPYACGVCGKRFSQSGYLTVHLRYHTGERPYSCGLCGRSFSHSSNFRKHQQTHIGQMMSNT